MGRWLNRISPATVARGGWPTGLALALILLPVLAGARGTAGLQAQTAPAATATATVAPSATPTAVPASLATVAPSPAPSSTPSPAPSLAPSATPAASTAPSPSPAAASGAREGGDEESEVSYEEHPHDSGDTNRVNVVNRKDNRLRIRGVVDLNHIDGQNASPVNEARALSSCTGCQTFAIALQIDLISRSATTIAPQNAAVALNYHCSGCRTVARAMQYVIQVDDPSEVPDRVNDLVQQMNRELQRAARDKNVAQADQAEAIVNNVVAQFTDLAVSLYDQRDETDEDTTPGQTGP